jgi:hypothetical protein
MYFILIAKQMIGMEIPFPEPSNSIESKHDTSVLPEKVNLILEIPNNNLGTSICYEKVKNFNLTLSSKNRMKSMKKKATHFFIETLFKEFECLKFNWKKKKKRRKMEEV